MSETDERWMKPIPEFPGYMATRNGWMWSAPRRCFDGRRIKGRWLKLCKNNGYLYVSLHRDGKQCGRHIHRFVLEAFVGPRPDGMECRHLNGNRTNNHLSNIC